MPFGFDSNRGLEAWGFERFWEFGSARLNVNVEGLEGCRLTISDVAVR